MMPLAQGRIHIWMSVIPLWPGPGRLWVGPLSPIPSPVLPGLPSTPLPPSVLYCFEAVTAIALDYCHAAPWCRRQMCKQTQGTHIRQHCIWFHSSLYCHCSMAIFLVTPDKAVSVDINNWISILTTSAGKCQHCRLVPIQYLQFLNSWKRAPFCLDM